MLILVISANKVYFIYRSVKLRETIHLPSYLVKPKKISPLDSNTLLIYLKNL